MTKAETNIAMVVLMIGGPIVGGLVVRGETDNPVLMLVGVVIAFGSWVIAITLGKKKPTDSNGGNE
ncbi:MAG: hypothetical protein IH984_13795 [Planctomycetes bacterium]|nr:hypothetical protein [Planctomycetota bacterium]